MPAGGRVVVQGRGAGAVLASNTELSFWGGVDPITGVVIDVSHPLHGVSVKDKVLVLPGGRGSSTGSQVMLELLLNKTAPAALVLRRADEILALGVYVAEELFGVTLPVVTLEANDHAEVARAPFAGIEGGRVTMGPTEEAVGASGADLPQGNGVDADGSECGVELTESDRAMLHGKEGGQGARVAMRVVLRMAALAGARRLIDITQAHIDGCCYIGPGGLRLAQELAGLGAKVRVPTTLNAINVDRCRWKELKISPDLGEPSSALADAYLELGATPSYTCAPYLLSSAPGRGDQVVWGESNAVVFANSVLGARTQKYADYMDICCAIVGRAPETGMHLSTQRYASIVLEVPPINAPDTSFYAALGYLAGLRARDRIPVLSGIPADSMNHDAMKAFGGPFATSSSSPMFHIVGNTPEAPTLMEAVGGEDNLEGTERVVITKEDIAEGWRSLNGTGSAGRGGPSGCGVDGDTTIQMVSMGSPHLSAEEIASMATVIRAGGGAKKDSVRVVATAGRDVVRRAREAGDVDTLERFGVELLTDTCWCFLGEPIVPCDARVLLTDSAKFAHYGPGLLDRTVKLTNMQGCIDAARSGRAPDRLPPWLDW